MRCGSRARLQTEQLRWYECATKPSPTKGLEPAIRTSQEE